MRGIVVAILMSLAPAFGWAQHAGHGHGHAPAQPPAHGAAPVAARETGQGAFAAIQEIVALLEADPRTDWSKVDVEALRRHLVDMDNVTLRAAVAAEAIPGGMRFVATGDGDVRDSIRRMVVAHAATMDGADGWRFTAAENPRGAEMIVLVPAAQHERLRALGFIGVMTRGMHHQAHHLMIARGAGPHR
jgi:hypothetical protein